MRLKTTLLTAMFLTFSMPVLADEYIIMKINGQDVTSAEVQRLWEGLFPSGQAPAFDSVKSDMRDRILRAVMAERLIHTEALKAGIDTSPKLLAELEEVKRKLVVRSFLESKTADMISEADIKRDYDTLVSSTKDEKEVRARHILTVTDQEAKEAKKKLDSGKSFDEVARDLSKDPGSAAKGGDLGYFTRDKMVKEFADAAFVMKKGDISGPVKSSFGYHIIKVEDIRKAQAPSFASLKEEIKGKLQEKKLNDYIANLIKSADVKTFDTKGKEVPFHRELSGETKPVEAKPAKVTKPSIPESKPAAEVKPAVAGAEKTDE